MKDTRSNPVLKLISYFIKETEHRIDYMQDSTLQYNKGIRKGLIYELNDLRKIYRFACSYLKGETHEED